MKRMLASVLLVVAILIFCPWGEGSAAQVSTTLDLSTGYRVDNLDWSVAGNPAGTNPNVLSELTWSDLEIFQIAGGVKVSVNDGFSLRGALGYGWIFSGSNQDSDFDGNNRTREYSRSNNSADGGSVLDASLGVGYQFRLLSQKLRLIPLVGYSYSEQNLTMTEGFQTISTPTHVPHPPPYGPIQGLDSTYNTQWMGPWVGLDILFSASEKVTLYTSLEYHWANYSADANWNLRTDLAHPKSFTQDANGSGFLLSLGGEYALDSRWALSLALNYQKWSTDPGIDRLTFADGSMVETRLNEVNWTSYAVILGLRCHFQSMN